MVHVDVLLTEARLADELVAAFRARRLPEKFFYWFPLSVRAWLDLCQDGAYRNFVRSQSLVDVERDRIAGTLPPALDVVSLGCGQGDKDRLVLQAIRRSGRRLVYVAVDASQALLEMACASADEAGIEARGLKLDLEDPAHWPALAPQNRPRLFLVLGNTMGAFDPPRFLARLAAVLAPEDAVAIDGEIFSAASMAGYDNPINRRFAFAPLTSVGIRVEDGALRFASREDDRLEGLWYFDKHFEPARDVEIVLAGERLVLARGERLEMNHSCKYSREAFVRLLREAGGLRPVSERLSGDGGLVMVLARPGADAGRSSGPQ